MFHPVMQEVTRALRARRRPPPPVVPTLPPEVLRRFGQKILRHPARREIAEGLLVIAIRLDVMGFREPRDQMLLLVGCGLTATEITDALEKRRADRSGAHALMKKARSTTATPIERMLREGSDATSSGVSLRSRQRRNEFQQARQDKLKSWRKERVQLDTSNPDDEKTKLLRPKPAGSRGGDDDAR